MCVCVWVGGWVGVGVGVGVGAGVGGWVWVGGCVCLYVCARSTGVSVGLDV